MNERVVVWQPQPGPQEALIACPTFEVLFGGARGGGKTDGVLGEWAAHADKYKSDAIGLMFRRSRIELGETIERSRAIYGPLGATWHDQDKMWRMSNGARLRMAYLERDGDAEGYQGHSYTRLYPEELGNFPRQGPMLKMLATLRSGAGVPVGMRATANPGGPGHAWVRARYIDPAPGGWQVIADPKTGLERVYIPSRIRDNRYLGEDYIRQLKSVGSAALVRAWLEGDWTAVEGAYFPEFSMDRHVVAPFEVPRHWLRFRAMDWGSAAPFCVGWWAVASEDCTVRGRMIPKGCMVGYREWYGTGQKLTAEELGQGIVDRERGDRDERRNTLISYGVLDPSAFANDGGPSIAERLMKTGAGFRPADNKRIARHGALGGWDQLRARLKGDELGRPMILWFHTCVDSIRTIPLLQHDPDKPEDLDSDSDDHAADACFVAGTQVETVSGPKNIESVMAGDLVLTRKGWRPVAAAFGSGRKAVHCLILSNGRWLVGTAEHPVFVEGKGFVALAKLRYGDMMRPCARQSYSRADLITAIRCLNAGIGGSITGPTIARSIGRFGKRLVVLSRKASTFITSMVIRSTTTFPIWPSWRAATIQGITGTSGFQNGKSVNGVGAPSRARRGETLIASAPTLVSPLPGERVDGMMLSGSASPAVLPLSSTATRSSLIARTHAPSRERMSGPRWPSSARAVASRLWRRIAGRGSAAPHVVGASPAGTAPVFNLTVADAEEYFANGVLVHNCRYACMSRPYARPFEAVPRTKLLAVGDANEVTLNDLWDMAPSRRRERV